MRELPAAGPRRPIAEWGVAEREMIDSEEQTGCPSEGKLSREPASSDASLLRRFRRGEQDAATELYVRYAKRLSALARSQTSQELATRVDPDDIVQSVFRTFFRRASEGHYDIPKGDELWRLFLVIALNKIRSLGEYHRAAKRDVSRTVSADKMGAPSADPRTLDEPALTTLRLVVDELLGQLPDSSRQIVELRIEGYQVAEISDRMRRSKRTVERVLQDFRSQLQRVVHEETSES